MNYLKIVPTIDKKVSDTKYSIWTIGVTDTPEKERKNIETMEKGLDPGHNGKLIAKSLKRH